jgi:hypothetical protein
MNSYTLSRGTQKVGRTNLGIATTERTISKTQLKVSVIHHHTQGGQLASTVHVERIGPNPSFVPLAAPVTAPDGTQYTRHAPLDNVDLDAFGDDL